MKAVEILFGKDVFIHQNVFDNLANFLLLPCLRPLEMINYTVTT